MTEELYWLNLKLIRLQILAIPELAHAPDKVQMALQALCLGRNGRTATGDMIAKMLERATGTPTSQMSELEVIDFAKRYLDPPAAARPSYPDPPKAGKPYPAWLSEAAKDIGRPRNELGRVYRGWANGPLLAGRLWAVRARRDLEAWLDLHPQPGTEPPGWPTTTTGGPAK